VTPDLSEKAMASKLIKDGKIKRSYIGIAGQDAPIYRRIVYHYNLPADRSRMVIPIEKNSPAEQAGVQEGDRIISFNSTPVTGIDDLHKMLTEIQVGTKTNLRVLRGTEILDLQIVPLEKKN
jgi:S1-C subfamily serine protease